MKRFHRLRFAHRGTSARLLRGLRTAPLLVGALLIFGIGDAAAQSVATLGGQVLDAESGEPLTGARVVVVGSTLGAVTDAAGRYRIARVPQGTHSVQASALGYAVKTVTGVAAAAGGTTELDLTLQRAAVAIGGLVVSAAAERGSVDRALDEQRTAVNVMSSISRQEIQRGPDDDAAGVVQRVSGVSVEDGKYVFVRGLGERYTTTQLNGSRLPSPEPDRRVVPLDLFPAGTLEGITVSKTFTPDQSGDFTGAQVDLRTRAFGSPFRSFSLSVGFNDAVTLQSVPLPPVAGAEWLGFASGARAIPAALAGGAPASNAQQATALGQFRNSWTATPGNATPNVSFSGSTGTRFDLGGREIQFLGALSYQTRTEARQDETRATPALRDGRVEALTEYAAELGRRSVLWGGVFNFATLLGDHTRLQLNNTYDRTSDNEALRLRGFDEELATDLDITRLQFVERTLLSSQLKAAHEAGRHTVDWSATYARVTRDEPDRSELVYTRERDSATGESTWAFFGGGTAPSTRAFGELAEHSGALQADYALGFGPDEAARLKLGSLYRYTARDATTRSFDFDNVGLSLEDRSLPAAEIFGGRFYQPESLGIRVRSNMFGGTYTAREHLAAGYAMVDYPLLPSIDLVGGARLEAANVEVGAVDVLGNQVPAQLRDVDLLPAAALNVRLTDRQNLRLSATRTLSRPEYRELAEVTYRDHVGALLVFGNPDLKRARIDNFDARWELYPAGGEVLSVGLFAKRFRDPIERVLLPATGAPVLTFRNADRAHNYGVELEARRRLGFLTPSLDAFTLAANATLVRSEVDFSGTDAAVAATSSTRPLLGQAPYVLNLSLMYEAPGDATATVLLNSVARRITEVGLAGMPDAYEQPRTTIDLAAELPVPGNAKLRIEAQNLLDARSEVRQGELARQSYRTGRSLSIGITVQP